MKPFAFPGSKARDGSSVRDVRASRGSFWRTEEGQPSRAVSPRLVTRYLPRGALLLHPSRPRSVSDHLDFLISGTFGTTGVCSCLGRSVILLKL
ncbi:hypothetical protein AGIG_G25312 [Arapaima gigas]